MFEKSQASESVAMMSVIVPGRDEAFSCSSEKTATSTTSDTATGSTRSSARLASLRSAYSRICRAWAVCSSGQSETRKVTAAISNASIVPCRQPIADDRIGMPAASSAMKTRKRTGATRLPR